MSTPTPDLPGTTPAASATATAAAAAAPPVDETLPLAVLDFVGIEHGESAHHALAGAIGIAQAVERAGFRRYWVSEHHNMRSLACSAPEILIAAIAGRTERIRVGAAGIMLPNHAPFKVAEIFRTLLALHPGRIDLGLGRAPGTDPLTAHVLRRGASVDAGADFPGQVGELLGHLGEGFPAGHPYAPLVAAPVVDERPQLFMLGSSPYGPQFAAANGMTAVFAHHQSPEIAVDVLREYRRAFVPGVQDEPRSAMSVLTFASDDPGAVAEFEAAWALTMQNLARGIREPLRPEEVREHARSEAFQRSRTARGAGDGTATEPDGRMVTGPADAVVRRLRELKEQAQVDEIVVVTPSLDRAQRTASFEAIATQWRRTEAAGG
ncbi:LLM class flavin-dependent oxidoreductase [Actinotalea sp. K2]|uniref:LLM class flavin-dependent oxidoreductase n=1 Tax=Actinotalea sp. K2 TaxID=2939438 RepID=UPI002017D15D|nr:LLM class flavin-dependent oxidoreductase [Actinotalea sp. K2]MCL3861576.1 LLM class flavin-dependent oxidoreductase [Actinotalea sp. K2]